MNILTYRLLLLPTLFLGSFSSLKAQDFTFVQLAPEFQSCDLIVGASLVVEDGGLVVGISDGAAEVNSNGNKLDRLVKVNRDGTIAWSLDENTSQLTRPTYLSKKTEGIAVLSLVGFGANYFEISEAGNISTSVPITFTDTIFSTTKAFKGTEENFYVVRNTTTATNGDSITIAAYNTDGSFIRKITPINYQDDIVNIEANENIVILQNSWGIEVYDASTFELISQLPTTPFGDVNAKTTLNIDGDFIGLLSDTNTKNKIYEIDATTGAITFRDLPGRYAYRSFARIASYGKDSLALLSYTGQRDLITTCSKEGTIGVDLAFADLSFLRFAQGNSNTTNALYVEQRIQDPFGSKVSFYDPINDVRLSPCTIPTGTAPLTPLTTAMREDGQGVVLSRNSDKALLVSPTGVVQSLFTDSNLIGITRSDVHLAAFSGSAVATILAQDEDAEVTQYKLYDAQGNVLQNLSLEGKLQIAQHLGANRLKEYGVLTKIKNVEYKLFIFDENGVLARERNLIDYPIFDTNTTDERRSVTDFSVGGGDTLALLSSSFDDGTSPYDLTIHAPDGEIISGISATNSTGVLFYPRFSSDGTFTMSRFTNRGNTSRTIEIHRDPFQNLIPETIIPDDEGQLTSPIFLDDVFTRVSSTTTSRTSSEIRLETIEPGDNELSVPVLTTYNDFQVVSDYDLTPFGIVSTMSSRGTVLVFLPFDNTVGTSTPRNGHKELSVQNPVRQEIVITLEASSAQQAELVTMAGQTLSTFSLPSLSEDGEVRIARPDYLQPGSYVLRIGEKAAVLIVE